MLSQPPRPRTLIDATEATVSSPSGACPSVLDAAALARLTELDPKGESRLLERVMQAFQSSLARLRPQLEAARRDGDRAAIRMVVHTVKSSSASIGATLVSQLCGQIETAIRDGADADADADLNASLTALNHAFDAASGEIDALLKARA